MVTSAVLWEGRRLVLRQQVLPGGRRGKRRGWCSSTMMVDGYTGLLYQIPYDLEGLMNAEDPMLGLLLWTINLIIVIITPLRCY